MSVDSGLCTVARLLTSIQKRANQSFALGMYALNSKSWAKSVVSNFRRSLRVASPRAFARARVYFARPTITIAKIRDYSQSTAKLMPLKNVWTVFVYLFSISMVSS